MVATIEQFCALAAAQVGVPYVFGGTGLAGSPNPGLDCSGLPYAVCLHLGVTIARTSEEQFATLATVVPPLRQGDLIFYDVPTDDQPQPAHESIYWSSLTVLQAPHAGENVEFSPSLPYEIMGYRRLPLPTETPPTQQENDTVTSWQLNGQNHVCGIINDIAYHWYQPFGGPGWTVEVMPLPA